MLSELDIYARVGSNKSLVLSDLHCSVVNSNGGLSIRFEGVIGCPIVCGISIRKDSLTSRFRRMFQVPFASTITY